MYRYVYVCVCAVPTDSDSDIVPDYIDYTDQASLGVNVSNYIIIITGIIIIFFASIVHFSDWPHRLQPAANEFKFKFTFIFKSCQ